MESVMTMVRMLKTVKITMCAFTVLVCLFHPMDTKAEDPAVLTGIDLLERNEFRQLEGRNIGLITNHTGINRHGVSGIQLFHASPNVKLYAIFSPEHGLLGKLDIPSIGDTEDPLTGISVFSLYGETRRPTSAMLKNIDTLVFDIQDIGTRFYTYISTMGEAMQAAAKNGIRFVVLDRPNPINGVSVSGPVLDEGRESFVGFHRLPIRHGMTIGELALMFNAELELGLDLEIIRLQGWHRQDYFDATGLAWLNPSPNMRSLTEAILYPGIGLLETTNLSVGRGTETPFELIGAPWLDGESLATELNRLNLPGIAFEAIQFTPEASKFEDQSCSGVRFSIVDRQLFDPLQTGFEIALTLRSLYPDTWEVDKYERLLSHQAVLQAIRDGLAYTEIKALYDDDLSAFMERRSRYILYP